MMTQTWAAGTPSPTGYPIRRAGRGNAHTWLAHLDADSYPPAVNLRPAAAWPDGALVADVDELARARQVQDMNTAAVLPDPRAERRRRLAELDLEFRAFCT